MMMNVQAELWLPSPSLTNVHTRIKSVASVCKKERERERERESSFYHNNPSFIIMLRIPGATAGRFFG